MSQPEKIQKPRTRIVKKGVAETALEVKAEQAEKLEERKDQSQKERRERFEIPPPVTYSPKELNDNYVKTVAKTPEEKILAKKAKSEWKKANVRR